MLLRFSNRLQWLQIGSHFQDMRMKHKYNQDMWTIQLGGSCLILDEVSVLERLKEIAIRNRIEVTPSDDMSVRDKIEVLRAGLNGVAFANAEKHMLPHWAIRKIWQGGRKNPVPASLFNDSYRNWTLIGTPGGRNFAIADSHGLTTGLEVCGSIEFWPKDSEIIFPALLSPTESPFNLISIEDQLYEWNLTIGPIGFQRLVYYAVKDGQEYLVNEINLQNLSLDPQSFSFFVALRPFAASGMLPISDLYYDTSTQCLYSNGFLALKLDREPANLIMTKFDDPQLLDIIEQEDRIDTEYRSVRGFGTAIARYDFNLRPAGKDILIFVSPLDYVPRDNPLTDSCKSFDLRDEAVATWFDFSFDNPYAEFPDAELSRVAAQASVSLVVQLRRTISSLSIDDIVSHSGSLTRSISAIAQSGYKDIAAIAIAELASKLNEVARVQDHVSALSPFLWVIHQIESLFPEIEFGDSVTQFRIAVSRAIEDTISSTVSSIAGSENQSDSVFHPDFASVPSIESITQGVTTYVPPIPPRNITLDKILESYWILLASNAIKAKGEDFDKALERFRSMLDDDCKRILKKKPWDYDSIDDLEVILGFISAFTLSKDFDIGRDLFEDLVSGMRAKRFYRGLIRYPDEKKRISSHHALWIAHAFVLLGIRHEAELILSRASAYFSDFHYLPEWIDPQTKGGTDGNGCSINAAAALKILLRDMMVYEIGKDLYIFSGIPEDWFTSEKPLNVSNIPTKLGMVSLSTGVSANQHQIEIEMENLPDEIEVYLPAHVPLHMVKVFGATVIARLETPNNRLRMIPLNEQIAITFHR